LMKWGLVARAFGSALEFLDSDCVGETRCLVLDIVMPGMSGPDLQLELGRLGHDIPIIFMTALMDETVHSRLLQQGAVECLCKPFTNSALREALQIAMGDLD
jgi:FixJ family two-component response regulator